MLWSVQIHPSANRALPAVPHVQTYAAIGRAARVESDVTGTPPQHDMPPGIGPWEPTHLPDKRAAATRRAPDGDTAVRVRQIASDPTPPIVDTILVGQQRHWCFEPGELSGIPSWYDDACATSNGEQVDFFFLPDSLCVAYTGLAPGRDSACFVLCDDYGACDTAYFYIAVVSHQGLPLARDDLFCTPGTPMGAPIVLDVLANDTLYGELQHIEIVAQPTSGQAVAILNLDRSITLIPQPPSCARVESFTYRVCNLTACDTATVQVCIECPDVQPFSAVSPNNDGYNDTFYIGRIEDFPDNHLRIYNRWGNLVFETRSYKNDWPGIWNTDKELPDGTYFFILEYDDRGERRVLHGFFELFR